MILNESEFKRQMKKKEFSNVYVIYGEEKFLVKVYTKQLVKAIMGKNHLNLTSIILTITVN